MECDPLVYAVIGHAQKVHRSLGCGIDELFYHQLLAERLTIAGVEHLFKPRRVLYHRGAVADVFEPDLVLAAGLIPEFKVLFGGFEPGHFLQLQGYLKLWNIRHGLLFDFGKESLVVRSYLYDDPLPIGIETENIIADAPPSANLDLVHALGESLVRVCLTHGFGFRDTTYRGLVAADLCAERIECVSSPTAAVRDGERQLGHATLSRFLEVASEAAVLVLSQRDGIRAADRALVQTALRMLELPWGIIAHFGRRDFQVQWVLPPSQSPT